MRTHGTNYGIHILKFLAIFFQIEVHAYMWITMREIGNPRAASILEAKLLLLKGAFSMLVPITAAAILRLSLPLPPGSERLDEKFDSRPFYVVLFGLALIESLKDGLVYGWGSFWNWNALHLIALSFLVILWSARYSINLLWILAPLIFLLTPIVLALVHPFEFVDASGFSPSFNLTAIGFALLWTILLAIPARKISSSPGISRIHKKKVFFLLALLWMVGIFLSTQITYTPREYIALRGLWIGILAGSRDTHHIWGFFPWGGMVICGFLIYDLVLRFAKDNRFLLALFVVGALVEVVFFSFFSQTTLDHCSIISGMPGFNPLCFNRTPSQVMMVIGAFLMIIPLSIFAERRGLEFGFIRSVSRAVFWVYIFETSVLFWIAPYWRSWFSDLELAITSFTLFSITSSILLALLIDHGSFKVKITLKRNT